MTKTVFFCFEFGPLEFICYLVLVIWFFCCLAKPLLTFRAKFHYEVTGIVPAALGPIPTSREF